jgi:hypothetical protein
MNISLLQQQLASKLLGGIQVVSQEAQFGKGAAPQPDAHCALKNSCCIVLLLAFNFCDLKLLSHNKSTPRLLQNSCSLLAPQLQMTRV